MSGSFINSWVVNSLDRLGPRPTGEAWNFDFPSYIDFDEEACIDRILLNGVGNSIEDGIAAWRAQVAASSEDETMLYEIFQLSINDHANGLLEAQRLKEDRALQLKQLLEESKKTLAGNRQKLAGGETAQHRADAAARATAYSAAAQWMTPSPQLGRGDLSNAPFSTAGTSQQGGKSGGVGQEKLYLTADGISVWTDHKGANLIIGGNLSLYRCIEPDLLKRYMDFSKAVWTLENAMLAREEDRLLANDANLVSSNDPLYSLTFWPQVATNPGLMDKSILEKLLRMQFKATDGTFLHYLMFYPYGLSMVKIQEKASHVLSLQAIQKIWWIFFGEAWRGALQPLLSRLDEGNLNTAFSLNSVQSSVHVMLTYQIQAAFAKVGGLLRSNDSRPQYPTEPETKNILILEVQAVFEDTIPPANNVLTNATRLLNFQASGKESESLKVIQTVLKSGSAVKQPGETKTPPRRDESTRNIGERPNKIQKLGDRPCLKNIMLQFFGKQAGLGDTCPPSCIFRHDPVSNISVTEFERAVSSGPNIFGTIFKTNGCLAKLRTAFGGEDNNGRQHPLLTPEGNQVQARAPQGGRGPIPGGRGRGRGRGRSG
jgi:hypothetical protein